METNLLRENKIPKIHLACLNQNLQEVEDLINEINSNVNLKDENDETPLSLCVKSFNSTNESIGDITPKYFDNTYVQIIIKLINNGTFFTSNLLHLILFGEKPIFTMDDFFDITTNKKNIYPIHNSIELTYLSNINMSTFDCYKKEYTYLYNKYKKFNLDIIDECRNIKEGQEVILLRRDGKNCIDLALEFEDKDFIANKYVQTVFEEKWEGITKEYSFFSKIFYCIFPFFLNNYEEWYNTPCIKFYMHTFFNIIFLFLLYVQTYTITSIIPTDTEIIIFIWILGYILSEINQFKKSDYKNYFSDKWNFFDILIILIFFIIILIRIYLLVIFNTNEVPYSLILSEHLLSVNIILVYLRILNVCQIHSILGPILLMLRKMIKDMIMFFCILSVFICGFSLGITKIYHRLENHKYSTISNTVLGLFCALFGSFEIENFESDYQSIEYFGITIFIIYLVIAVIILINLFIAMLSNSYAIIQEDSDIEWKFSRVCLIITYSMYYCFPPPLNIFYRIIEPCFRVNKVEPVIYKLDIDPSELITTQNLIERFYSKKKLIENKPNDLEYRLENISRKLELFSNRLYHSTDLSPINK